MKQITIWIIFITVLFSSNVLWAACGGSSPNWISASTNRYDVADCIAAASNGDTIVLPAGSSSTWSSRLEITKNNIVIKGQGVSQTTINGYGFLFSLQSTGSQVTDIHFNAGSSTPVIRVSSGNDWGGTPVTGWMIEGNKFTVSNSGCIRVYNGSTGLIANNEFIVNGATTIYVNGRDDNDWNNPSFYGQLGRYVIIEDNKFISISSSASNHVIMSSWGGSYTFRCNLITDSGGNNTFKDMVDVHGYGHGTGRRAGRAIEVYGNTFDNKNYQWRTVNLRGGSGRMFANRWTNANTFIGVTDYRMASFGLSMSYPTDPNDCSTNSANYPADLEHVNCIDHEGYPCCDQVGMGQDLSGMQQADPFYFWDNKGTDGTSISITPGSGTPSSFIQENREYFLEVIPQNYQPYTYPHPDRNLDVTGICLSDGNSAAKTAITFWEGGSGVTISAPKSFKQIQ